MPDINVYDLAACDEAIASNAFEGRGPDTRAGEAAARWIADEMKCIGLQPGNHGSYFQTVPAVTITPDPAKPSLVFSTPKGKIDPKFSDQDVYWTSRVASRHVAVKD